MCITFQVNLENFKLHTHKEEFTKNSLFQKFMCYQYDRSFMFLIKHESPNGVLNLRLS